MSGQVLTIGGNSSSSGGGGSVDEVVTGTGQHIAVYGDDGETVEDSGSTIAGVIAAGAAAAPQGDVIGPASAVVGRIPTFTNADGKQIGDSGKSITDIMEAAAALAAAPNDVVAQNSFLVDGGSILWVSAYTFRVSAATYYINGVKYTAVEQSITLGAADATNDRIDVIAVDNTGTVVAVAGTAAAQPSEPDVDPATQVKLGVVLVTHATTAPVGVTSSTLFAENAGTPTEMAWTSSGVGWTIGSTNNPKTGTKSIEGTNVAKGAYAQGQSASDFDPNTFDTLVFYIRSKAQWATNRALKFQFYEDGAARGRAVTLSDGTFGFDSSITNAYQLVVIPIPQFAVVQGAALNQLRITDTNGTIGFYLDDLILQKGLPDSLAIDSLTINQADARYASLVHASRHDPLTGADPIPQYRKVGFTLNKGGQALATGIAGEVQVDFAGTIIGWSIVGDQAGSISIDVCKKAGTQTTPAVPNTTTDKISASAPIALSTEQAKGAGTSGVSTWTAAVARWDTILFNVTAVSTLTRATGYLIIKQN